MIVAPRGYFVGPAIFMRDLKWELAIRLYDNSRAFRDLGASGIATAPGNNLNSISTSTRRPNSLTDSVPSVWTSITRSSGAIRIGSRLHMRSARSVLRNGPTISPLHGSNAITHSENP